MPGLLQAHQPTNYVPILQCLSSVVLGLGHGFLPYAPPVFQRCIQIVRRCLVMYEAFALDAKNEVEEPDRTHLIVALDLLSGLTQALSTDIQPFFANSEPSCIDLMVACFKVSFQHHSWCHCTIAEPLCTSSTPSHLFNSPRTLCSETPPSPAFLSSSRDYLKSCLSSSRLSHQTYGRTLSACATMPLGALERLLSNTGLQWRTL